MERGNFIHLAFIIDASGSMYASQSDVVNGFKQMIEEQKAVKDGKCAVSLYTFADTWKEVFLGKDVSEVEDLEYRPFGCTAMNDGIGTAIDKIGKWLSDMDETDRPGKNLIVIMTDGEENSSKEYSLQRVQEMIKHQIEKYSWDFIYVGTDITTKKDAVSLGINKMSMSSRRNFCANYDMLSKATTAYRSCDDVVVACATMDSYLTDNTAKMTEQYESEIGKKLD